MQALGTGACETGSATMNVSTLRRLAPAVVLLAAACAPLSRVSFDRTPLTLDDPIRSSTRARLAGLGADPAACRAWLGVAGVAFTPVADRTEGESCSIRNALTLGDDLGDATVRLSPRRPMMTCSLAAALVLWRRQSVELAAWEILGAGVTGLDHYGVYACRRVSNQIEGRYSAHARASAVDIAGFRLSNGRRVSVERDWPKDSAEARFLRRIRDDACRVFDTALSPDYNAAHANHLHLETGGARICA